MNANVVILAERPLGIAILRVLSLFAVSGVCFPRLMIQDLAGNSDSWNWPISAESVKDVLYGCKLGTNDEAESSSDTNTDKQRKGQFQKTLPQQAQDAIARAVKQALKKINDCHPELHEHLRYQQGIRIGTRSCVYSPKKESEWILENE